MHPGHQYSSQLFCTYTKHLSEDLRRSQHAYLLNVCHSSCCWYFLYVHYDHFFTVPSAPTTTGITPVFKEHILCISSSRSLYLLFFSIFFGAMFLSDGAVISISLQVEFTESSITISGPFTVRVQSVLTGMSHMMVMLLSFDCASQSLAQVGTICLQSRYHDLYNGRYAAALLCLEMYSVLANILHPDTI